VKQHSDKIRKLVLDFKFFSATTDKMINTIKSELFDVSGGAPIVGSDHPVVREMMALPAPVKNCITCIHPSPGRTTTARHACLCTRTLRADHVQNGKTTCSGNLEQQCQKSLHALLCENPTPHAAPMLPPTSYIS
jgi:hypothetical protein